MKRSKTVAVFFVAAAADVMRLIADAALGDIIMERPAMMALPITTVTQDRFNPSL